MHQPVEENNIKFIRMNTGEDVLTEITKEGKDYCFINPLKVVYGLTPKKDGIIITLAQWVVDSICEKQEFNIKINDVLMIGEPSQEIIEYYHEAIERNSSNKSQKMRALNKRDVSELEEELELIPDEEMEFLKSVLDGIKDQKRKLH